MSQDFMIVRDLNGKVLKINPAIEAILGWKREEAYEMDLVGLVHPDDRSIREEGLERIFETGGSTSWKCRILTKDGAYKWLQWSCTVDIQNHRSYFVGRDVTEGEELLMRLEESQRNLMNAQALGGVGSWSYDVASGRFSLSDQYYRILGFEPGGFAPTWENCLGAIHPDDRSFIETADLVKSPTPNPEMVEVRIVRPDGETRFVRSRLRVTVGPDGQASRLDGTIEDVTDRKHSQAEMEQVLSHARCLLWQAEVTDENGTLAWNTHIRNSDAAKQFLDVEVPPGMDYSVGFYLAKLTDDAQRMEATSSMAITSGQSGYQQEFRVRLANGEIRWLFEDVHIEPMSPGNWRLTGVCTDVTDSRKAQEEMAQVLERARCMLWQADLVDRDGVLDWDLWFRNPDAAQKFLPLEIPEGQSYTEAFDAARMPEEQASMRIQDASEIPDGVGGYQQEFRVRTADGEIHWLSEDVTIEPVEPGRWLLTGVCTDVTERRKAEEEISHVLSSARCLLWRATVTETEGVFRWNLHFQNPEAAQQFLPVSIPEGRSYSDGFDAARPREYSEAVRKQSRSALRSGQRGYQQEFPIRVLTGELRWIYEDVNIELIEEGHWRLTGVCTDITEQKKAQEETAQVLESARCLLWQAQVSRTNEDFEWDLRFRNPEAAYFFLPVEIPQGGTYTDGFFAARPDEFHESCNHASDYALLSGQSGYQQEYPVRTESGDLRWLSEDVHIEPIGEDRWQLTGVCTDITERKRVETSMSQVQVSARCLLWQGKVLDFEGQLKWSLEILNPEAAQQFLELQVAPGDSYTRAFYLAKFPECMDELDEVSRSALRAGQDSYHQEYPIRVAGGEVRWLAESVSIEPEGEGLWRLTGVCVDITDRKLAEEALRKSEAKYQRIVANVPGVVSQCLMHPDGSLQIVYLNAGCFEMFGRTVEEYMADSRYIWETVHADYRESLVVGLATNARTLTPLHWEGKCVLPSGEEKWIEVTARPEMQPNQDVLWDCLLMDVTSRKDMERITREAQAELQDRFHDRTRDLRHANVALQEEIAERHLAQEELKASEARYRAIVEDQTEMICRFLADGTLTFVNDAHCRYYNESPESVLGKSFIDFLSPDDAVRIRAHLEELGPDNPVGSYEICSQGPGGEVRWQHWTDRYILNEDGEFVCFQAVGSDITARKESQQALLLAKEEAERANRAKSEFLSRMSHELRTPLNAILGFGQYLDSKELEPIQKESVHHILRAGRHLLDLINEVLDLARVESGKTEVSIEPVCVRDVVQESLDLVQSLATENGIRLTADLEALERFHAQADQQRFKQVMINLLTNGIKYNRRGGSVEVRCSEAEGQLRIDVRDSGIGIDSADVPRLFTPFERLTPYNSAVEGTGLGLALSQRLVELMGGTLAVQSAPGVGSTFSICLPAAVSPIARGDIHQVAIPQPGEGQSERHFKVLCIEDNLSNLRLMEVILSGRAGVELVSAMQGRVGLDMARSIRPNLILLDLNLPDISGKDVLEELRREEDGRRTPIVIISADATPIRIERLLAAGADAYLTKPLNVNEFLTVLDRFMTQNNTK